MRRDGLAAPGAKGGVWRAAAALSVALSGMAALPAHAMDPRAVCALAGKQAKAFGSSGWVCYERPLAKVAVMWSKSEEDESAENLSKNFWAGFIGFALAASAQDSPWVKQADGVGWVYEARFEPGKCAYVEQEDAKALALAFNRDTARLASPEFAKAAWPKAKASDCKARWPLRDPLPGPGPHCKALAAVAGPQFALARCVDTSDGAHMEPPEGYSSSNDGMRDYVVAYLGAAKLASSAPSMRVSIPNGPQTQPTQCISLPYSALARAMAGIERDGGLDRVAPKGKPLEGFPMTKTMLGLMALVKTSADKDPASTIVPCPGYPALDPTRITIGEAGASRGPLRYSPK